jgi:hypothetical protein
VSYRFWERTPSWIGLEEINMAQMIPTRATNATTMMMRNFQSTSGSYVEGLSSIRGLHFFDIMPVDTHEVMVLEYQVIAFVDLVPLLLSKVKAVSLVPLVDNDIPFVGGVLRAMHRYFPCHASAFILMSGGEVLLCHYSILRSSPK